LTAKVDSNVTEVKRNIRSLVKVCKPEGLTNPQDTKTVALRGQVKND